MYRNVEVNKQMNVQMQSFEAGNFTNFISRVQVKLITIEINPVSSLYPIFGRRIFGQKY